MTNNDIKEYSSVSRSTVWIASVQIRQKKLFLYAFFGVPCVLSLLFILKVNQFYRKMWTQLLLFVLTLYFLYRLIKPKRPNNFPPGPAAYPLVGSIPAMLKLHPTIPGAIKKLGEIYGPVSSVFLGKNRAIVVHEWETVKEVLTRDEFTGRPPLFFSLNQKLNMQLGIMFVSNNDFFKTQRRFQLRALRDWGFGKSSLEGIIHEEIQETFVQIDKKIQENPEGIISIDNVFGIGIVNILWAVVAGERFSHDNEILNELLRRIYAAFRSQSHAMNLISDYPFLRHLPYFSTKWHAFLKTRKGTEKFIEDVIDEHEKTRDRDSPRDFIDQYLNEIDAEREKQVANSSFFREQLVASCMDIFLAGSETVSNSVAYGMLYMILYPEVQEKVFEEINQVVGQSRLPSYEDRTSLPYTEAVLSELSRITSISPLTVPHFTIKNAILNGFSIPKDTMVFISLTSVLMDPEIWKDPEEFKPERFLDADGKFFKPEQLIPFGLGKRVCMGEALARTNYYLFFTSMIQRYRIEMVENDPPSPEPVPGFTFAPQKFKGRLVLRSELGN